MRIRMKIIKRSGEEVVFDASKIVDAIARVADLFSGIKAVIQEICEEFERNLVTALHSFAHWMIQFFSPSGRRTRTRIISYNPALAVCTVLSPITACVKILILVAASVKHQTQASYLLRTQDRGSSDSHTAGYYPYAVA